jgi:hypothetical protein
MEVAAMTDRCPGCQSDKREERRVVTYLGEDVPHECEHYWHDGSVEEAGGGNAAVTRTGTEAACYAAETARLEASARQPSERSAAAHTTAREETRG